MTGVEYWLVLKNNMWSTTTYWDDGSSSTYRRWAPSEPDSDLKTCIYYHTGGLFYDSYCSSNQFNYICKMAPGKLPIGLIRIQYIVMKILYIYVTVRSHKPTYKHSANAKHVV